MGKIKIIILACLFISGCYGLNIYSQATAITTKAYPPANNNPIEVYFDDNNLKISKLYEQLAMIEVQGIENSSPSDLLSEMRKKAAEIGADAVINVKQNNIVRERGVVGSSLLDDNNKPEKYFTISLSGIAIKYQ